MKTKQIAILVCMVVAGVFFPIEVFFTWRPLFLEITLGMLPYVLLPIAAYVGMKEGFKSDLALTINTITLISMIAHIILDDTNCLWWAIYIPGIMY